MKKQLEILTELYHSASFSKLLAHCGDTLSVQCVFFDKYGALCGDTGHTFPQEVVRMIQDKCRGKKHFFLYETANDGNIYGVAPLFIQRHYSGCWLLGPFPKDYSQEQLNKTMQMVSLFGENLSLLMDQNTRLADDNIELQKLAHKLDSTAQIFTTFINSTDMAFYVSDFETGEVLMANHRCAEYIGIPEEELVGMYCWQIMGTDYDRFCPNCPRQMLVDSDGTPTFPHVEEQQWGKDNTWLRLTNQAVYWGDGRLVHMITFVDITEEKQIQSQLSQLAFYDKELGLPNRLKLTHDLEECKEGNRKPYLLCLDIVALRKINDLYGRETGDALILAVKNWILSLDLEQIKLYRIGGDEFCLLFHDVSFQEVERVAYKIVSYCEDPWQITIKGATIPVYCNISMGIIDVMKAFEHGHRILDLVERIQDTARAQGTIAVYDEKMDQKFRERLRLEWSLRKCIREDMKGFSVAYQPIIDPVDGRWCGLEALCRWNSPEHGPVPPVVFINEAEKLGLINRIGTWVLDTAVGQCKQWRLDRLDDFMLDVNLSPAQLLEEDIEETVRNILLKYEYPGSKLSLEVTESMEVNYNTVEMQTVRNLQELGVVMVLDDFGTGYANFDNLKKMPASRLKTERKFIENIENDDYLQFLFNAMSDLAHAADMEMVAEGVETSSQLKILLRSGVDYLQGYLFSRPLSSEDLEEKLERFYSADQLFATEMTNRLNLSKLLDPRNGHVLTPKGYALLHHCMQELMTEEYHKGIPQMLEALGQFLTVDKVVVQVRTEPQSFERMFEWAREGTPCCEVGGQVDLRELKSEWNKTLEADGLIAISNLKLAGKAGKGRNHPDCKGAIALLLMPIWVDGEIAGALEVCDCTKTRDWGVEEALLLYDLSLILSNLLRTAVLPEVMKTEAQTV